MNTPVDLWYQKHLQCNYYILDAQKWSPSSMTVCLKRIEEDFMREQNIEVEILKTFTLRINHCVKHRLRRKEDICSFSGSYLYF